MWHCVCRYNSYIWREGCFKWGKMLIFPQLLTENICLSSLVQAKRFQSEILWLKLWKQVHCIRRTQIAHKVRLHIRRIVLKNFIYLEVQNIHTYPQYKTTHHLITSAKCTKMAFVESTFTYNTGSAIIFSSNGNVPLYDGLHSKIVHFWWNHWIFP